MRWGDKAKNDDHYLLLESQKEFKKDSRRVAIKVNHKVENRKLKATRGFRTVHQRVKSKNC